MEIRKMTFSEACAMIYGEQLQVDVAREEAEKGYLPQEAFGNGCRSRGKAISYNAEMRVDNFKGLAIALHRGASHGDEVTEEIEVLKSQMPADDITLAEEGVTVYGWWKD